MGFASWVELRNTWRVGGLSLLLLLLSSSSSCIINTNTIVLIVLSLLSSCLLLLSSLSLSSLFRVSAAGAPGSWRSSTHWPVYVDLAAGVMIVQIVNTVNNSNSNSNHTSNKHNINSSHNSSANNNNNNNTNNNHHHHNNGERAHITWSRAESPRFKKAVTRLSELGSLKKFVLCSKPYHNHSIAFESMK